MNDGQAVRPKRSGMERSKMEKIVDSCSPRVKNLQTEMDSLRAEIQRLKAIDINTYTSRDCRDPDRRMVRTSEPMSRKAANKRLLQLGLAAQISDEEESDVEDFESFIRHLREERARSQSCSSSGNRSVSDAKSDGSGLRQPRLMVSKWTETDELVCLECGALREERVALLSRLNVMEDEFEQLSRNLQIQQRMIDNYDKDRRRLNVCKRDVGVMSIQLGDIERPLIHRAVQTENEDLRSEILEAEVAGLRERISELEEVKEENVHKAELERLEESFRQLKSESETQIFNLTEENTVLSQKALSPTS